MTPNETKLTDAMSSALANVDPVIAQALRPHLSPPRDYWSALTESAEVTAFNRAGTDVIELTGYKGDKITLNPDQWRALVDFVSRIGWQCD